MKRLARIFKKKIYTFDWMEDFHCTRMSCMQLQLNSSILRLKTTPTIHLPSLPLPSHTCSSTHISCTRTRTPLSTSVQRTFLSGDWLAIDQTSVISPALSSRSMSIRSIHIQIAQTEICCLLGRDSNYIPTTHTCAGINVTTVQLYSSRTFSAIPASLIHLQSTHVHQTQ